MIKKRIFFPVREYEDIYIIIDAFKHRSIIVSNDLFRDIAGKYSSYPQLIHFLKHHVMPYDFVSYGFQPSPSYVLPPLADNISKRGKT